MTPEQLIERIQSRKRRKASPAQIKDRIKQMEEIENSTNICKTSRSWAIIIRIRLKNMLKNDNNKRQGVN